MKTFIINVIFVLGLKMSSPVNLSPHFSQSDYTAFLHSHANFAVLQEVAQKMEQKGFLHTKTKIVPMFYQIYHPQTKALKGCLLGCCHGLKPMFGIGFADVPEIFGKDSKVQQCFSMADTFAGEINIQEVLSEKEKRPISLEMIRERVVEPNQVMDAAFEVAAREMGKKITSLETEEEYQAREVLRSQERLEDEERATKPYDWIKCFAGPSRAFETGSEQLFKEVREDCDSPFAIRIWLQERTPYCNNRA
jgi:hypothetical protein